MPDGIRTRWKTAPLHGAQDFWVEITREHDAAKAAELDAWADQVAKSYGVLPMDAASFRLSGRLMRSFGADYSARAGAPNDFLKCCFQATTMTMDLDAAAQEGDDAD